MQLGAGRVSEGELEEAERSEIQRNGDRLHPFQARFDRHACSLDVAAIRVNKCPYCRWAAEILGDLFGEFDALVCVARRERQVATPAFKLCEMHEDIWSGA